MDLGSTQALTEMSIKNLAGGKGRPTCKADNFTAICEPIVHEMLGALTSHNPMGLHVLLHGYLYFDHNGGYEKCCELWCNAV
jgi:hypothetical protein